MEVKEIRKQINIIRDERKEQHDRDAFANDRPENVIFAARENGYNGAHSNDAKCNFQTDIDPKPDIQVDGSKKMYGNKITREIYCVCRCSICISH